MLVQSCRERKFWWFDNCGSHNSQWRKWITQQSSIRRCGTRFGNSVVTILPMQNKNLPGDPEEPNEVLGADEETKSHSQWQFLRIWQILWRIILESLYVNSRQIRKKGIAERAVRRVKEGTSAVLLQSGLDKEWWADSMECYCYLRNIQDLLSDGKTPYERRFGMPLNGPVIPFGALIEYHFIPAKDISRLHQFCPKVLPRIFLGYAFFAVGIWKEDLMVADIEELEQMDASEIHARRLNAKEVSTPTKGDNFTFLVADGTVKTPGGNRRLKPSTLITLLQTLFKMTQHAKMRKLEMISGLLRETSFNAITWNPESNCTCREKNHSQFHWNISTLPERLIHHWM